MAEKYHINPETGRANQCSAKIKCRFGAETKHYASKKEARGAYEKTMKKETVSKPLKKTSTKTSTNSTTAVKAPKKLPIIPGVPPVMSAYEIKQETQELENEVREWGPELFNVTVKRMLEDRGITLKEIAAAEHRGEYSVMTKIPSYYEVNISTDVARKELGLPSRDKTGIDESPLRKAQVEYDNAYAGTFGSFSTTEEYTAAREKMEKAKAAFEALRYPDRKPEPPRMNRGWGYGR